jgi:photosystem II stability/assembly factor-like uncharacterized protein
MHRSSSAVGTRLARFFSYLALGAAFLTAANAAEGQKKADARAASSAPLPSLKGVWEPVGYPEDVELVDVFFVDPSEGWVAGGASVMSGGILLHTRDAGEHWDVQVGDSKSSDRGLKDLRFIDPKHGWVVQGAPLDAKLLHTTDGQNWQLAGSMETHYADYAFTSDANGAYVMGEKIFATRDGGRSWRETFHCRAPVVVDGLTREKECGFQKLQFLTPAVGYAIGSDPGVDVVFVAKTVDGGSSWSLITAPVKGEPQDAFFVGERTGYLRTGPPDSGQLFKTSDGGQTWIGLVASPGSRIRFADPGVGWAVQYKKVSFTSDGGNRWSSREYAFPVSANAFSLPRRDRGYVVGDHGMIYRYRTVPVSAAVAKGGIPAPLLSGIDSPLEGQVQKLASQVQTYTAAAPGSFTQDTGVSGGQPAPSSAGGFTQDAGAPPGQPAPSPSGGFQQDTGGPADGGFVQDVGPMQATADSVSNEVPRFDSQYRNLNLLQTGFAVATQLPAQVASLKASLQALKGARDPQSSAAAVVSLKSQVEGIVGMVKLAYQKN